MAVAACAATLLGACSDDSKQAFIDAADEACREADAAIAEIGQPRVEEGVLDYVRDAREISEELVADLRALDPPADGAEQVEQMIDGLERATDLLEPLAQATIERDSQQLEELQQEIEQITDEVSETAESYGFETCGAKVLDPIR
ncbi:MAG TPA: hypothetical protein VHI71_05555 [Actinomycetota bacterium]|nr:hypothetical protein [Actinomycetota bacterium]